MRFKLLVLFILGFFILNSLPPVLAQTAQKKSADSAKAARARATDSTTKARQHATDSLKTTRTHNLDSTSKARLHTTDSIKVARQHKTDSVTRARKRVTDSTASIRKYKESKHYRDSVTRARTGKTKALQTSRQAKMDSLKQIRQHATDSMALTRKTRSDSVKTVQKHRSDSLATVKKYKTSKRYTDSVTLVRRQRSDSLKSIQKAFRDSVAEVRRHVMDSAKVSRAHIMDSTKTVRTKYMDSVKLVRKNRTDSLAKVKANKDKMAKAKEKKKQQDLKLKLELKMKQKREAWSNKSMLKKRWSPVRRLTQNSFTHYNYYYNANRKMDEAEANMQRARKENYDSLIGLYPFDPNRDSSLLAADMDSIIRKVSVGIQIHDPRIKWSNDLYLLLGQAYYYKGSYENASIAFRYIIAKDEEEKKKRAKNNSSYGSKTKEEPSIVEDDGGSFLKHRSVHNEAILWLARTYTESGQVENAGSVLSLLEFDSKLPDNLQGRLAQEKAFAYLASDNNEEASKQLDIMVDDDHLPSWLRQRAAFLNGQLLQNEGKYTEAAASFEKVLDNYPKIDMDFYARKYIASNKLMAGEDVADAMDPLKKILNDGKYVTYYDQVYYVLGKLAAKANKPDEAITYLTKSTATPKATKKQRSLSFAALGDVYYSTARYASAKVAYDSAAKYSTAASKDKAVVAAIQRSNGLKEMSGPMDVIHDQDSLLALAAMSRKDQQGVVRRYLRDLEKRKEDSIFNAENAGPAVAAVPEEPGDAGAAGWYFANPALMAQGSTDFKRKWGSRPLTDNWRRSSGGPLTTAASTAAAADDDLGASSAADKGGALTEEGLMARIPNTPQQKELAIKLQQRAYILLAKAYVKQLEDYNQALHTLDTLDSRYPSHNQKEEELYLRYQIAIKQNKLDKAQAYSQELLAKFPKSEYASSLRPRQSESKQTDLTGKTVSQYFDETYKLLQQRQFSEVLMRIDVAKKQYDNSLYKKRFQVTEAMAYAGQGNYDMADTLIGKFIKATPPADSLAGWARSVQQYIAAVRNGGKPSWYKETPAGSLADAKKEENKETPVAKPVGPPPPPPPPPVPAKYEYSADSQHYCIVVLPGLDSRTAGLKQGIKTFDSIKYTSINLDLLIDLLDTKTGVLLVKGFTNAKQAQTYASDLKASATLKGYEPGELQVYTITTSNYKKLFADKNPAPYASFYSQNYRQE